MPFCCIAIVGFAMLYFTFLSLRQLFLGTCRDTKVSLLPAPPRALTGNYAQPVYGHTRLFTRSGGDCAHSFPSEMREWRWLPGFFSRTLGECFSIFIWGQWRVVVKGPERARKVLEQSDIREGWAWNPPVTLLGRTCLPLIDDKLEADFLSSLLATPLGQRNVVRYAPEFAEIAERFVDDLIVGKFKRRDGENHDGDRRESTGSVGDPSEELERLEEGRNLDRSSSSMGAHKPHKIKWNALRSYTFDLIDGPVFRTNKWTRESEQSIGEASSQKTPNTIPEGKQTASKKDPTRSTMLLWMERLKAGMCVIKMTFGAEWMYIWMMNEYGRAVNGRMHIEKVISAHVADRTKHLPIQRGTGLKTRDPVVTSFPLFTMAENMFRRNENVLGEKGKKSFQRPRSRSAPDVTASLEIKEDEWAPGTRGGHAGVPPPPPKLGHLPPNRQRCDSSPVVMQAARKHASKDEKSLRRPIHSVLDSIMGQHDSNGRGMTQAVVTELAMLLWMIMDAGNAWTAMALHLLSMDQSACDIVQQELDGLADLHGKEKLFSPRVLAEMKTLDALIWEAIRLTPPFLGGMKVVSHTIEFPEDGLQIPQNTNVIFCQPTDGAFNLSRAMGKKPESMAHSYPSVELHGFLPFQGQEVPLMVLQSKVFLAVLLQRCSPFVSRKRTFIRRVKAAITKSPIVVDELAHEGEQTSLHGKSRSSNSLSSPADTCDDLICEPCEMTQTEAMKVFTKIPFPEPRRVLHFTERNSMELLHKVSGSIL